MKKSTRISHYKLKYLKKNESFRNFIQQARKNASERHDVIVFCNETSKTYENPFKSDDYIKLKCGNETFHVPKQILTFSSLWFSTLFQSNCKFNKILIMMIIY